MAHELTLRADGRAEMAFADVTGTPWHGLGQKVTTGASIDVWKKEAGLDWKAEEAMPMTPQGGSVFFRDYKGLYRSDNKEALAIVGAGYNVVQPAEVLEFFRDMTEAGGWHIHTAGSLRGGRKVWAMASNAEGGIVGKAKRRNGSDLVMQNLLLATSLDGSMKTVVQPTTVCVVCANTLRAALENDQGDRIAISHRSVFDAAAVKRTLGVAQDAFKLFMLKAEEMADMPVKLDEARELLNEIFGVKKQEKKPDLSWMGDLAMLGQEEEQADSRLVTGALDLFQGLGMGADMSTRKGTRWGLLNSVTQYVDHVMGRSDDTRLDSAWFGRGAAIKDKALELISA